LLPTCKIPLAAAVPVGTLIVPAEMVTVVPSGCTIPLLPVVAVVAVYVPSVAVIVVLSYS